jgi:phosphate transport system permease protein
MINRMLWRKFVNLAWFTVTGLAALLTISVLFFILGNLTWHGAENLNWAFLTQLPKPVGEPGGGMANAIVGTAELLLLAAAIGLPFGFLGGVYLAEFGGQTFPFIVRYTVDLLNGVPSIVMGIFAFAVVVVPMKSFSLLAGGLALGAMMIPIAVRSTEEFLRTVPGSLREAGLALGATHWRTVATVVVPAAFRGILTGVMLDLARVAGETAPLLFTAFGNRFWSSGWNQPIAALPLVIYTYALSAYDDWHRQAWAAALLLLLLVLAANIIARVAIGGRTSLHEV